ncbi:hypothetical protein PR048_021745 [Dryococelus australis]|uniref:DUF659 domain-containing protein n=1 Tax=Dryococelus australis TaxID=614101 RepID=A0ABQ9GZ18_9NEOP|nr:hypothetical protein PR048_021745 [Dryococelus australis]
MLERINHATVTHFVNDGLMVLWPDGSQDEKVLVLYSDAASYMLKAATALCVFYPKIIHSICLAHGLGRITEVGGSYPQVNKIVSCTKKVFLKAPYVLHYRELLRNSSIAPLNSTNEVGYTEARVLQRTFRRYKICSCHFLENQPFQCVLLKLHSMNHTGCVLAYIQNNFSFITASIKKLETLGLFCEWQLDVVECNSKLSEVRGNIGRKVLNKFEPVLARNPATRLLTSLQENICLNLHQPLLAMSKGSFPLTKTFYQTSDIP